MKSCMLLSLWKCLAFTIKVASCVPWVIFFLRWGIYLMCTPCFIRFTMLVFIGSWKCKNWNNAEEWTYTQPNVRKKRQYQLWKLKTYVLMSCIALHYRKYVQPIAFRKPNVMIAVQKLWLFCYCFALSDCLNEHLYVCFSFCYVLKIN